MKAKPFVISKQLVMQAYRLVKANRGLRVWIINRLMISRRASRAICIVCGIGCPRGVTFPHR